MAATHRIDRSTESSLAGLPRTFTPKQARQCGMSDRRLYALRDAGLLEPVGRGLYQRTDLPNEVDPDLLEVAHRTTKATLCLTTALARHRLTDVIPATIDVAVPRGHRRPRLRAPVTWHTFSLTTFHIGRDDLTLSEGISIGIYNPQRCIVDAFRLRHAEGTEIAHEALRRWLRHGDTRPAELLTMAHLFPQAEPAIRAALEILL